MGYGAPYPIRLSRKEIRNPLQDGDQWNGVQRSGMLFQISYNEMVGRPLRFISKPRD